jgi:hypothetical protein
VKGDGGMQKKVSGAAALEENLEGFYFVGFKTKLGKGFQSTKREARLDGVIRSSI